MRKNIHTSAQVPVTIENLFNYFMYHLVFFFIEKQWFYNNNRFKVGDLVRYNWKAKYHIRSVYNNEVGIKEVTKVHQYKDGTTAISYKDKNGESGCDAFWLTKA